jgi:uncharacterized membrane protein
VTYLFELTVLPGGSNASITVSIDRSGTKVVFGTFGPGQKAQFTSDTARCWLLNQQLMTAQGILTLG